MLRKPNIKALFENQDLDGLVQALRFPGSPDVRAEAAKALGAMNKFEAVESLVRSRGADPDMLVQKAALAALHELLGNEAESVIASYGPPPDDEPWVQVAPSADPLTPGIVDIWKDLKSAGPVTSWEHDDIHALMAILRTESNEAMRLRAIRALSQISSTEAIDALAKVALWEEDDVSREAAHTALAAVFGESLPEVLESYREGTTVGVVGEGEDEELEELSDEDEEPDEPIAPIDRSRLVVGGWYKEGEANPEDINPPQAAPARLGQRQAPVIQEVKAGWGSAVLIGVLALAAVVVAFLFFRR